MVGVKRASAHMFSCVFHRCLRIDSWVIACVCVYVCIHVHVYCIAGVEWMVGCLRACVCMCVYMYISDVSLVGCGGSTSQKCTLVCAGSEWE